MLLNFIYETSDMNEAIAYVEGMASDSPSVKVAAAAEKLLSKEADKFQDFVDGNVLAEMISSYLSETEPFNAYDSDIVCNSAFYKVAKEGVDVFLVADFEFVWNVSNMVMSMSVKRVFSSREPQGLGHVQIHVNDMRDELDENGNYIGNRFYDQQNGYAYEDMKEAVQELASQFYVDSNTGMLHCWY